MLQKVAIKKNSDDFFELLISKYDFLEENIGREYKYKVDDKYGRGFMYRFSFRNGIEITMGDFFLERSLDIYIKIGRPVFGVTYCISGNISYCVEKIGSFLLDENQVAGIYMMKDNTVGWIKYPNGKAINYISVWAYSPFIKSFYHGNTSKLHGNPGENTNEKIDVIMKPQRVNPFLQTTFNQMINCRFEGANRLVYLESKAMEIISLGFENEVTEHPTYCKALLKQSDKERIRLAEKILIENITSQLTIKELAKKAGLNTFKLKTGFKELFGTTVFKYLKDVRLEKARLLLLEDNEMSVNEIVNEVGYCNPSHFAKAFRNKYGVNPRDLRFRS